VNLPRFSINSYHCLGNALNFLSHKKGRPWDDKLFTAENFLKYSDADAGKAGNWVNVGFSLDASPFRRDLFAGGGSSGSSSSSDDPKN